MAIYEYNEDLAGKADDNANKLTDQGAYVGSFKRVWGIEAKSGAEGLEFEFHVPGQGDIIFSLYTLSKPSDVDEKGNRKPLFGAGFLNSIQYMFGLKRLESVEGTVEKYDEESKSRVSATGDTFPSLCGKPIGLVFQKELYTTNKGGTGERLALYGVYQPETKLTFTELKEKKTKAEKLDRLLKGLKVKDQRKKGDEVAQPSLSGVGAGDF